MEDYIATITLNRTEPLSAFTEAMINQWVDAIEAVKTDPKVSVLVVTGMGRGFCSGMDVRGAVGRGEASPLYIRRNYTHPGMRYGTPGRSDFL